MTGCGDTFRSFAVTPIAAVTGRFGPGWNRQSEECVKGDAHSLARHWLRYAPIQACWLLLLWSVDAVRVAVWRRRGVSRTNEACAK